jgi:BMFP domain-containing protein YqiC
VVRRILQTHRFGAALGGFWWEDLELQLAIPLLLRYHVTMDKNSIENLARKLADAAPEGLKNMRAEMETTFQSVLSQGLNKLDLVTREEFEVQEAVLLRTREKLEALEQKIGELEKT